MSIKTDSLYIDNFPALHAGLVGKDNWQIPVSGQWVPSITGEGATGTWNINISGTAASVRVDVSDSDFHTRDKKCYFTFCSGENELFRSNDVYISGNSTAFLPRLVGAMSNPYRIQGVEADACVLWTNIDDLDGPAVFDSDISLATYVSGKSIRRALRVPNLVIGNNPPNDSNLLTNKLISIAGCPIPIWGGSVSAATLRNKLNLSSALRFVGQTVSSIDDGDTQYPIINGEVYTPLLGDVIIQSSTGYEYLWTGSAWERLGPDGSYKIVQDEYTSVNEPIQGSSGNFISNITQDSNGNISVEKKTLESLNLIYPTGQKKVYSGSNLDFSLSLIDNSSSGNYWPLLYGMNYRSDATGTSFDSVVNDKFGIAQYANKIYIQPSTGSLYTNNFYALNKFITKIENYTTSELVSRTTSNTNEDGTTTNLYNGELRLYGNNNKYTVLRPGNPTKSIALNLPITGDQTLIGTAGSNALAGNFIPATNNKIDLGASDKKWQNIYATTFNGNLVGIADAAKKVSNSLTINNRGKEITFNGEKSATLIVNRRCSVGRSGAFQTNENAFYTESNQLKSWQKIASIAFQPVYTDREIVFKVSKGLDAHQHSGILRAHLRVNASTALADKVNKQLIWEYANKDIDTNNFMLTVAADTTNNKIIGEIWINIGNTSYDIYHFDVMQEHDRSIGGNVGYSDLWTLYNRDGSKEEDWQYFDLNGMSNKTLSVLATIKNNASTASSLSGTRTANTVLAAPNGSNGTATFRKLVAADLPIASATEAGIITTGTQSLAGDKTFTGNLVMTKNGGMIKISSKDAHDDGTTYGVALHVGSHLVNRGLFDITNNKWMVYKDTEIDVVKTPSLFQAPRIILTNTTDAKLEKYDTVALTIGSSAAQHLEFDNNEIVSKTNASTAGILGLNMGGSVQLGKMILQSSNYGTLAPTDSNNTNTSSPVNGQIYFQLIE